MPELKQLVRRIFLETLGAINIPAAMQRKIPRTGTVLTIDALTIDVAAFRRVCVIAMGKAAHAMLMGLKAILPENIAIEGLVSAPTPPSSPLPGLRYFVGGHPAPNAQSWEAARAILALLKTAGPDTLVFFLVSGGGSALVELPQDPGQTLEDVQSVFRTLVTCGASIDEINVVRKHLSAVKGGRLAEAAPEAAKITIAVSDVPAGKESALASGPTLADPSTIEDCRRVIAAYNLEPKFPAALRRWLTEGGLCETPKPGSAALANTHFCLLLGMEDLFHPAHLAAEAKGCIAACDNTTDDWPIERAADYLLAQIEEMRRKSYGRRVALIADGELRSPVTGDGIGGRNSAFVLECVKKIANKPIAVLSAGTDGIDGNSPAAGAVADGETLARAQAAGLDPASAAQKSDAFTFFAALDDAIITGPTGTNLRDLRILVADP